MDLSYPVCTLLYAYHSGNRANSTGIFHTITIFMGFLELPPDDLKNSSPDNFRREEMDISQEDTRDLKFLIQMIPQSEILDYYPFPAVFFPPPLKK